MVVGQTARSPGATARKEEWEDRTRFRTAHGLLIVVCVGYAALVTLRTSQSMALTWDEVVYASQVAPDVPAAVFSAPRSRGMSLLLAPVSAITPSIFALRLYLTALSALLMYVAFRPWLSALRGNTPGFLFVPAVAAGLFATLWTTVLYGTMAYPNLWLAFLLVAGVGWYCVAVRQERPSAAVVVAIGCAFTGSALLRPTDAVAASVPLLVAALFYRTRRWIFPTIAVTAGLAVGWAAWVVEAFIRFSGPFERLNEGAASNEGGLTWSLPLHLDAVDGPRLLCRPHELCEGFSVSSALWWMLLPAFVVVGVVAARRLGGLSATVLAACCGLTLAFQYFVLIDYAAPRFLQPTYALLAVPAAAALVWFVNRSHLVARVLALTAVGGLLIAHFAVQQRDLGGAHELLLETSRSHGSHARFLDEEQGVAPPCVVVGQGAVQIGYLLKCRSYYSTPANLANQESLITEAMLSGEDVVIRVNGKATPPDFVADWRYVELPGGSPYVAYLPPTNGMGGRTP